MSDDLIKREDAMRVAFLYPFFSDALMEEIKAIPSADRPQGFWTKVDVATYSCSECGKHQIADDTNELNFCCCCGSRNKVRMKGADAERSRR